MDVPKFGDPTIAATTDNRFVLAWWQGIQRSDGSVDDIYYAMRDSNGGEIRAITKFTNDTPGWDDAYYSPTLTRLPGNRALLAFQRSGNYGDIYYSVLDSAGNAIMGATNLVGDGTSQWDWRPDAVQLSDGKVVVAWTGNSRIRFAVLNTSYNRVAGPTTLTNPAAVIGDGYVSLTADAAGHAILTWMDYYWSYRPNLYYTLVDSNGNVLTQPMIFRTSQAASPYIETSFDGYGNTSYSTTLVPTATPTPTNTPTATPTNTSTPTRTPTATPPKTPTPTRLARVYLPIIVKNYFPPTPVSTSTPTPTPRPIQNPSFEDGLNYWQTVGVVVRSSEWKTQGQYSARLGDPSYSCAGGGVVGKNGATQTFDVPYTGSTNLTFDYRIVTEDSLLENGDYLQIEINDGIVGRIGWQQAPSRCSGQPNILTGTYSVDLLGLGYQRGASIKLGVFIIIVDPYYNTYGYTDNVRWGAP